MLVRVHLREVRVVEEREGCWDNDMASKRYGRKRSPGRKKERGRGEVAPVVELAEEAAADQRSVKMFMGSRGG